MTTARAIAAGGLSMAVVAAVPIAIQTHATATTRATLVASAELVARGNIGATPQLAILRDFDDARAPRVRIVKQNFAVASWYGGGGGSSLWKRHGSDWTLVIGGGGSLGVAEMRRFGVPPDAWCAFGISGAPCPHAERYGESSPRMPVPRKNE